MRKEYNEKRGIIIQESVAFKTKRDEGLYLIVPKYWKSKLGNYRTIEETIRRDRRVAFKKELSYKF